ncbi:MAG: hypothetical protein Q9227_000178 [Pyrenula ochraceoflavens]
MARDKPKMQVKSAIRRRHPIDPQYLPSPLTPSSFRKLRGSPPQVSPPSPARFTRSQALRRRSAPLVHLSDLPDDQSSDESYSPPAREEPTSANTINSAFSEESNPDPIEFVRGKRPIHRPKRYVPPAGSPSAPKSVRYRKRKKARQVGMQRRRERIKADLGKVDESEVTDSSAGKSEKAEVEVVIKAPGKSRKGTGPVKGILKKRSPDKPSQRNVRFWSTRPRKKSHLEQVRVEYEGHVDDVPGEGPSSDIVPSVETPDTELIDEDMPDAEFSDERTSIHSADDDGFHGGTSDKMHSEERHVDFHDIEYSPPETSRTEAANINAHRKIRGRSLDLGELSYIAGWLTNGNSSYVSDPAVIRPVRENLAPVSGQLGRPRSEMPLRRPLDNKTLKWIGDCLRKAAGKGLPEQDIRSIRRKIDTAIEQVRDPEIFAPPPPGYKHTGGIVKGRRLRPNELKNLLLVLNTGNNVDQREKDRLAHILAAATQEPAGTNPRPREQLAIDKLRKIARVLDYQASPETESGAEDLPRLKSTTAKKIANIIDENNIDEPSVDQEEVIPRPDRNAPLAFITPPNTPINKHTTTVFSSTEEHLPDDMSESSAAQQVRSDLKETVESASRPLTSLLNHSPARNLRSTPPRAETSHSTSGHSVYPTSPSISKAPWRLRAFPNHNIEPQKAKKEFQNPQEILPSLPKRQNLPTSQVPNPTASPQQAPDQSPSPPLSLSPPPPAHPNPPNPHTTRTPATTNRTHINLLPSLTPPHPLTPPQISHTLTHLHTLISTLASTHFSHPSLPPSSSLSLSALSSQSPELITWVSYIADGSSSQSPSSGWPSLFTDRAKRVPLVRCLLMSVLERWIFDQTLFGCSASEAQWLVDREIEVLRSKGEGADSFRRSFARARNVRELLLKAPDGMRMPSNVGTAMKEIYARTTRLLGPLFAPGERLEGEVWVRQFWEILEVSVGLHVCLRVSPLHAQMRYRGQWVEWEKGWKMEDFDAGKHSVVGEVGVRSGREEGGRERLVVKIAGGSCVFVHTPGARPDAESESDEDGEEEEDVKGWEEVQEFPEQRLEEQGYRTQVVGKARVWCEWTPERFRKFPLLGEGEESDGLPRMEGGMRVTMKEAVERDRARREGQRGGEKKETSRERTRNVDSESRERRREKSRERIRNGNRDTSRERIRKGERHASRERTRTGYSGGGRRNEERKVKRRPISNKMTAKKPLFIRNDASSWLRPLAASALVLGLVGLASYTSSSSPSTRAPGLARLAQGAVQCGRIVKNTPSLISQRKSVFTSRLNRLWENATRNLSNGWGIGLGEGFFSASYHKIHIPDYSSDLAVAGPQWWYLQQRRRRPGGLGRSWSWSKTIIGAPKAVRTAAARTITGTPRPSYVRIKPTVTMSSAPLPPPTASTSSTGWLANLISAASSKSLSASSAESSISASSSSALLSSSLSAAQSQASSYLSKSRSFASSALSASLESKVLEASRSVVSKSKSMEAAAEMTRSAEGAVGKWEEVKDGPWGDAVGRVGQWVGEWAGRVREGGRLREMVEGVGE